MDPYQLPAHRPDGLGRFGSSLLRAAVGTLVVSIILVIADMARSDLFDLHYVGFILKHYARLIAAVFVGMAIWDFWGRKPKPDRAA